MSHPLRGIDTSGESYSHGTCARYVLGCRCQACRDARAAKERERVAAAREAAIALEKEEGPRRREVWVERPQRTRSGRVVIRRFRGCPGAHGRQCPHHSHLRHDSPGGICARCASALVYNGTVDARPARLHLAKLSRAGVGYKTVADAAGVSLSVVAKIRSGERRRIRRATRDRILEVDEKARPDVAAVDSRRARMMLKVLEGEYLTKDALGRALGYRGQFQLGNRITVANEAKIERLYRRVVGEAPGA